MSETKTTDKKSRPRRVFGRVRCQAGGHPVTLQMSKTEIIVRPLRRRRTYQLALDKVALLVMAHSPLK